MRAFVFPGQGSGASDAPEEMMSSIGKVIGEIVPDQVKLFAHAARDTDEARRRGIAPDIVAGHSLGEYGAVYAAGCFDFETGVWLVAQRDRFLSEVAREAPGGMVAVVRASPEEVEAALGAESGAFVANYNSPRQTVVSGLEESLEGAVEKITVGRKIPLKVSFAAHSPYVAPASEKMRKALDSISLEGPDFPVVSAIDGSVLTTAAAVRTALEGQMVSPVRWINVVETLLEMGVTESVELGGGNVLTKMLRDFDAKSLSGVTFEKFKGDLRKGAPDR